MKEFRLTFSEKELAQVAGQFLQLTKSKKQFAVYGNMGAGKTTFITALCKQIGTNDLVSSPTFAIVNEYSTFKGKSIFHCDFYRIQNSEELLDIGFYDYCTPDDYCFIEWPERAENIIPEDFLDIYIQELEDGLREITFKM